MKALVAAILLLCGTSFPTVVQASPPQSGAPYLAVAGESTERLPLTSTRVDVVIAGVIADVKLQQVYENRGTRPIEALYVFPGSTRAAVYGLTMRVGDRVIRANIREKKKAREEYEQARSEGKTASLLEQLDPSVFRMNVANVLPGDRIEVELRYTELLVPERGVYEFFFPNTMGQRYGETLPVSTSASGAVVDYAFDIRTTLIGALPLQRVESPSHAVDVAHPGANRAVVTLAESAIEKAGASDYVLRYSLAGDAIQSGLIAYPEGDGGYFLLTAEPPRAVTAEMIAPREFVFVVDVSGSMMGEPLDAAKALVRDLFGVLRPTDRFNVVLFSGGSKVMAPGGSLPATPDTLKKVLASLDTESGGGGTELVPALDTAFALPAQPGMARSIVVVTDGQIAAGGEAFRTIRAVLGRSNVFAFGVGSDVDRPVIEMLARAGAGEPFIVDEMAQARAVALRMRSYIDRPLLTQIDLGIEGFDAYDLEPSRVGDLLAERPVTVVGRYRGTAGGRMIVRGRSGGQPYEQTVAFDQDSVSNDLAAVRLLWARTRIQRLLDEQTVVNRWEDSSEGVHAKAIAELGLGHSLLTPYTSFVAIDQRVRTDTPAVAVQQPAVAKPGSSGIQFDEPVPMSEPAPPGAAPAPPAPAIPDEAAVEYEVGYSRRGTGNALGVVRLLDAAVRTSIPESAKENALRRVGARTFGFENGAWIDRSYREGMTILRIRRGSAAYARLLELHPDISAVLALGEDVLIVVGGVAVRIAPQGFSDFPEATLRKLRVDG